MIRLQINGIDITCDTPEEALQVVRAAGPTPLVGAVGNYVQSAPVAAPAPVAAEPSRRASGKRNGKNNYSFQPKAPSAAAEVRALILDSLRAGPEEGMTRSSIKDAVKARGVSFPFDKLDRNLDWAITTLSQSAKIVREGVLWSLA